MNVRLIAVGKIRERYVKDAVEDFRRRLKPYYPLEEIEVRASDGSDPARAVAQESQRILQLLDPADTVWLLEREGEHLSSKELALRLASVATTGITRLTFVIAGTFGAAPELKARAQVHWSLSRLTFLHEWARAIVLEQLYRAAKIARNEPYHH
ncbi:MAG: 23S rRNA (pseudouridine(1915)-N(3))-methyltransferase RlmH [Candidatus Eremiobacteraeota bacterium]|nr:23S rRNA (pseudouridine(1915)-N(3))-methyltransferase RlmH [Candidatus Eremiobacteraeota bacterium]